MNTQDQPTAKPGPNFTLAFQQMASFVAIAKTNVSANILDELIQQCFVLLPNDSLASSEQVVEAITVLFGIQLNNKDVEFGLQRLIKTGQLSKIMGGHYRLSNEAISTLQCRIDEAKSLEQTVRDEWIGQVHIVSPDLDGNKLWVVLRAYLARAFRRHGIQAVQLLDPSVNLGFDAVGTLTAALDQAIAEHFQAEHSSIVREAVSAFFITVGANRKRAEYVTNLADGAFNYFSLAVAPEISEKLRGKLNPLTLFLDTNFLFGILNLHVNPQVDVSGELIAAIQKFKLPFRLRYHEATVREMSNTLAYFGSELRRQRFSQKISRAVVASGAVSGIELRYHAKNAETAVVVDDFLAPYQHWQVLLKDKGIDVYNVDSSMARLRTRADLEAEYKEYLRRVHREKPDEAVQHDMAVLETVRSLRSTAKSTLEAGSILVTCDYHLFRFGLEKSRNEEKRQCSVLPSLLWQILRPFVSESEPFDKAFAETFALPEFSLVRGGAQRAAARMASILASYSEIPEETATKMLANDLLIAELQTKRTDQEFERTVESAVAKENTALVEDRAALARQVEYEKAANEAKTNEIGQVTANLRVANELLARREQALKDKEDAIQKLEESRNSDDQKFRKTAEDAIKASNERQNAENRVTELQQAADSASGRALHTAKVASVITGLLLVAVFLLVIHFVIPWPWLLEHPNGYGLQCGISLIIFFGILGAWVKPWRTTCWVVGVLGLIGVVVSILGGPKAG